MISAEEPPSRNVVDVLGRRMAYVEMGAGRPIVFQLREWILEQELTD